MCYTILATNHWLRGDQLREEVVTGRPFQDGWSEAAPPLMAPMPRIPEVPRVSQAVFVLTCEGLGRGRYRSKRFEHLWARQVFLLRLGRPRLRHNALACHPWLNSEGLAWLALPVDAVYSAALA